MTPLERELADIIAAEGPISLERFMALAAMHPTFGYYRTGRPIGRDDRADTKAQDGRDQQRADDAHSELPGTTDTAGQRWPWCDHRNESCMRVEHSGQHALRARMTAIPVA